MSKYSLEALKALRHKIKATSLDEVLEEDSISYIRDTDFHDMRLEYLTTKSDKARDGIFSYIREGIKSIVEKWDSLRTENHLWEPMLNEDLAEKKIKAKKEEAELVKDIEVYKSILEKLNGK